MTFDPGDTQAFPDSTPRWRQELEDQMRQLTPDEWWEREDQKRFNDDKYDLDKYGDFQLEIRKWKHETPDTNSTHTQPKH